ncbi:MAG: 4Fe-4S dicluster domain-containing protein [Planctomycetes bacterium]|jgi:electron transport complex protein RnfC|nr:4Fe-4S dicluster domain-containing protein [Planctomycetota bacterium]
MLLRQYGSFAGGIDLPDEKHSTLGMPIEPAARQGVLRVPLAPCAGPPARMLVPEGTRVSAGERIAAACGGVDVYAPCEGRIGKTVDVQVVSAVGVKHSPAIELVAVGQMAPIRLLVPVFDWRAASSREIRTSLAGGGLTTAKGHIEPLNIWVERGLRACCKCIIANVVEPQPYVTSDHRMLVENGAEVIRGLMIIAKALEVGQMLLAVDQRRVDQYRGLVGAARACNVAMVALPAKYPAGNDTLLVKVLHRRETPIGKETFDVGAAVIDASTCFAAYRWVACQSPQTARVVTVSGQGTMPRGNFWTPYGADCQSMLQEARGTMVIGGPMAPSYQADNAVVCAATDAVLNLKTPPATTATPCIRCGWCTDHCPARLNVKGISDAYELGKIDRARRLHAGACIECGVCSYVCPARLGLCERVVWIKRLLQQRPQQVRPQELHPEARP